MDCLQQAIHARAEAREAGGVEPSGLAADALAASVPAPDGLGYLGPDPLISLGLGLEAASSNWIGTWRALTRVNNRFDQLWYALVETLGEVPPFISPSHWWERARMRPSPVVEDYLKWPVEVLGNPLLPASRILARLAECGIRVRPVAGWACSPVFRTLEEADNYRWHQGEERRRTEGERLEEGRLTVAGDPDYRLLARARRAEAEGAEAGAGCGAAANAGGPKGACADQPPLPSSFEEFLELVQRAFGPEPPRVPRESNPALEAVGIPAGGSGSGDLPLASGASGPAPSSSPAVEARPSITSPGVPLLPAEHAEPVDDAGRVRRLAELLWERVELVRERAEREARRLVELVDAYGDALGRPQVGESAKSEEPEASEEFAASGPRCLAGRVEPLAAGDGSGPIIRAADRGQKVSTGSSAGPRATKRQQAPAAGAPERVEEQETREEQSTEGLDRVERREGLASTILEVFREKRSGKLRSGGPERVIRLTVYDLAVARFGKQPDFGLLKLTHDRFNQLHQEFFQTFFAYAQHLAPDAGGA